MSKVRIIKKNTLEEFLGEFGISFNRVNSKIYITDIYPSLPKEINSKFIVKVNNNTPLDISSWLIGDNIIEFEDGSKWVLTLVNLNWETIVYKNFTSSNFCIIQCINFGVIPDLDEDLYKKNIVLDLRVNFGGELHEMETYYAWFDDLCNNLSIDHKYILVSNATCSSAELFTDKFKSDNNTTIVGSETYKKKYIYKQFTDSEKKVLVPVFRIETEFNIDVSFDFDYYYPIKSLSKLRYYKCPEILVL